MKLELCLALVLVLASGACDGKITPQETIPVGGSGGQPSQSTGSPIDGSAGAGDGSNGHGGAAGHELAYGRHGYFPKTVTAKDAKAAYETWRDAYVDDCGEAGLRVGADDPSETLAEGVAYGALLAAAWGDRETFDGLWQYYRKAAEVSDETKELKLGLMGWRVWSNACKFAEVDAGAPAQSALDMAMALVVASCHWPDGDYLASSRRMMRSIKTALTTRTNDGYVLMTADDEDPGCMRPGYFSPGYYRVFAGLAEGDPAFWSSMAADAYVFLDRAANPTTGLVPEWASNEDGSCPNEDDFVGYDAVRTTWRVTTDYAWFGKGDAQAFLARQIEWFDDAVGAARLADLRSGFFTDGSEVLGEPGAADSGYVGAVASGAAGVSQKLSDAYFEVLLNEIGDNDDSAHAATGRALFLALGANKLSSGCY